MLIVIKKSLANLDGQGWGKRQLIRNYRSRGLKGPVIVKQKFPYPLKIPGMDSIYDYVRKTASTKISRPYPTEL